MKVKKMFPVLLLFAMAVMTLTIRHCRNSSPGVIKRQRQSRSPNFPNANSTGRQITFDRRVDNLFFTKHAKCRMHCRHITQDEVKDILLNGTINYDKSNQEDLRGPTYALEGFTNDRQHVRIIFAPKQQHLTVVTVIDLDVEYMCDCN